MNVLTIIARIVFAVPFAYWGVNHFIKGSGMAGSVPAYFPAGTFWVYLTGLGMIAAAISIIINKCVKLSTSLLAIVMLIFVFTVHLPQWFNPASAQMGMNGVLKDLVFAAGAYFVGLTANGKGKKKK